MELNLMREPYKVIREKIVTARKEHVCFGCSEIIPKGAKGMNRQTCRAVSSDKRIYSLYFCDACNDYLCETCYGKECAFCFDSEISEGFIRDCKAATGNIFT